MGEASLRATSVSLRSGSDDESSGKEDPDGRLSVVDLAALDHLECPAERDGLDAEELVGFVRGRPAGQAGGEKDVNLLIGEAGRRIHGIHGLNRRRGTAGLFAELTRGTGRGRLAGLEAAGGDLVEIAAGGVAVLLDEKELGVFAARVGKKGDHGARSGVANHLDLSGRPVGELDEIDVETDHLASVDPGARALSDAHRSGSTTSGPNFSSSSWRRSADASPRTPACNRDGSRCRRAAASTESAVTARMWARYESK